MRKILSGIICLAIIFLGIPGTALAENTPKQAFINDYLSYMDNSLEMQEAILLGLQQNTIKFVLNAELSDVNVSLEDGTRISNMLGKASFALALNLNNLMASLDFNVKASEYNAKGQVFFNQDGLIVPRETIWSLSNTGADFKNLGDLDKLPPYVVYDTGMSAEDFTMLTQAIKEATNNQAQQMEIAKALIKEMLNIFPEKCFYYIDSKPVMDLTRVSLVELLGCVQENSGSLTDQLIAATNKPVGMSDGEFAAMKEQMKASIVDGINSLSAEDLNKALKELPVSLLACKIILSPDNIESVLEVKGDLPDGTSFSLAMNSSDQMKGSMVSSAGTMDLSIKSPDFNLDLHMNSKSSTDPKKGDFSITLSGKAGDNKNSLRGKMDLTGSINWSQKGGIYTPQITFQNSKKVKFPSSSNYTPVTVFLNGEILLFADDAEPILKNGVTTVPIRSLADALGCELEWQEPGTVIFKNGSGEDLVLTVDSTSYQIGDKEHYFNEPPFIFNGRVYVPLRLVSEYCGLTIDWDSDNKIVKLKQ